MGDDFYEKLGRKDDGARQELLGASYQTLTDPVAIIRESKGGMTSDVYIKSFLKDGGEGHSIILSVAKPIDGEMVVVTTYQRHTKEVYRKIKKADSVVYQKDNEPALPAGVYHANI
jgi:hypothetical protein